MQHLMTLDSPLGGIYSIAFHTQERINLSAHDVVSTKREKLSQAINISVKAVMTHSNYTPCFIAA